MNGMQLFRRTLAIGLAVTALGASSALAATRPDDRGGPHGVGATRIDKSDVVSRYLTRHKTFPRPDDRAGIRGVGSTKTPSHVVRARPLRPDDRPGRRGA